MIFVLMQNLEHFQDVKNSRVAFYTQHIWLGLPPHPWTAVHMEGVASVAFPKYNNSKF
jgi:hypothetical protein